MNNPTMSLINLDRLAAKHAQAIVPEDANKVAAKKIETTVTKALGILQENGVYACFLYLLAKEGRIGKDVVKDMLLLLEQLGFNWDAPRKSNNDELEDKPDIVLHFISDTVTENLERLLLAKETLEQMLIYARYGAKAKG
jgi:hypothetical protein